MPRVLLFCCMSAALACCLLVSPYAIGLRVWSVGYHIQGWVQNVDVPDNPSRRLGQTIRDRDSVCKSARESYRGHKRLEWAPVLTQNDRSSLLTEGYKTAASEIKERISQEQVLLALKFVVVGAIMSVLFTLSRRDEFEAFVHRRRAAVFFAAALVSSVLVDMRLRFNSKIIESLGAWVWCVERASTLPTQEPMSQGVIPWEHLLHVQLEDGVFPVMRYFSLSLTLVLYCVVMYLFIVMPKRIASGTREVVQAATGIMSLLLFSRTSSRRGE